MALLPVAPQYHRRRWLLHAYNANERCASMGRITDAMNAASHIHSLRWACPRYSYGTRAGCMRCTCDVAVARALTCFSGNAILWSVHAMTNWNYTMAISRDASPHRMAQQQKQTIDAAASDHELVRWSLEAVDIPRDANPRWQPYIQGGAQGQEASTWKPCQHATEIV